MAASLVDAATVNTNGIKTLLGNGLSIFSIKVILGFSNVPRNVPRNPPDCTKLDSF